MIPVQERSGLGCGWCSEVLCARHEPLGRAGPRAGDNLGLVVGRGSDDVGMQRTAYGDESQPDRRVAPGEYVLAFALVGDAAAEETRELVRGLKLPGQRKLHWHSEDERRRRDLTKFVADLDTAHLVAVRTHATEHSERRRRMCLKRLLPELEQRGVTAVALEAREKRQNADDVALIQALRAGRELRATLRMQHPRGPGEPLLWIADIVAGAVTAHRQGQSEHYERLASRIQLYDA